MKNILHLFLLLGLAGIFAGCATPYMVDRGRDAADIFTATVGEGSGVKARVGPFTTGLFRNSDKAGLRGGSFFSSTENFQEAPRDRTSLIPYGDYCVVLFVNDDFRATPEHSARHKSYQALSFAPFISWIDQPAFDTIAKWPYYTQIEVAVGFGGTLRLGFNPGELLDFFIGLTTVDIFNDDLEMMKRMSPPSQTNNRN